MDEVFLVWLTPDQRNGSNIAYRVWQSGWGEVGFVNEPDSTNTTDTTPSISTFGDMGPVVVWAAGPSMMQDYQDIVSSRWVGAGWSGEETISIPDSAVVARDEYPQVALGPDGRAWASWKRWGPWPENPDYDIWYAQGQVYPPPTSSVQERNVPDSAPLWILRSVPNPAQGFSSTVFVVREPGRYEAVVQGPTGRVLDRVDLGVLEPGLYADDRAFRWPARRGVNPRSGVYFVRFENVSRRRTVASAKFVLLR